MSVSTSSLNIKAESSTDFTSDHTQAIQAILNQTTHVIIDTIVNLSG